MVAPRKSGPHGHTFQKSKYHISGTTIHIDKAIPAKKLDEAKKGVKREPAEI
jgi:hypothetical protein